MFAKSVGDCCPKCRAPLIRRRAGGSFRSVSGDVAYCARCNSAWELAEEQTAAPAAAFVVVPA